MYFTPHKRHEAATMIHTRMHAWIYDWMDEYSTELRRVNERDMFCTIYSIGPIMIVIKVIIIMIMLIFIQKENTKKHTHSYRK